jgi:hypothetical protein
LRTARFALLLALLGAIVDLLLESVLRGCHRCIRWGSTCSLSGGTRTSSMRTRSKDIPLGAPCN